MRGGAFLFVVARVPCGFPVARRGFCISERSDCDADLVVVSAS